MIRSDKVWHFADVLHFAIYYINVLHLVLASGFASWVKYLDRTRASLCFTGCHTARWETVRKRVQPTHSNSTMSSQSQYSKPMYVCVSFSKKQPWGVPAQQASELPAGDFMPEEAIESKGNPQQDGGGLRLATCGGNGANQDEPEEKLKHNNSIVLSIRLRLLQQQLHG